MNKMRRKENEITDPVIIEDILSRSEICRIAMNDNDRPYIVPLNYGYRNNIIYFHSAPHGKKIDLLKADSRVCFEIELSSQVIRHEVPCEWSAKFRSVIGYGIIEIVSDPEQKKEGLSIILEHYGKTVPSEFTDKQVEKMILLRLRIDEITGKQKGNWG